MNAKRGTEYSCVFTGKDSNMKPHPQFLFQVCGLALPTGGMEEELLTRDFVQFFCCYIITWRFNSVLETRLTSSCSDFCVFVANAEVIDLVFTFLTQQINEFECTCQTRNHCSVPLMCGQTHPMVSTAVSSNIWQQGVPNIWGAPVRAADRVRLIPLPLFIGCGRFSFISKLKRLMFDYLFIWESLKHEISGPF